MAQRFAITSREEARAYWQHPVLGSRLRLCIELMLAIKGRSAFQILDTPDDLKFHTCNLLRASLMKTKHLTLAAALSLSVIAPAFAGKPLNTDDAGTIAKGECEIEAYASAYRVSSANASGLTSQFSCGVVEGTQLGIGLGRYNDDTGNVDSISLSGKTQIIDGGKDSTSLSLGFGAVGTSSPGQSMSLSNYTFSLLATKPLTEDFSVHFNAGLLRDSSRGSAKNYGIWGLAGEYALTEKVALVGETYGQEGSKPWTGVGARWQASKALSLGLLFASQGGGDSTFTMGAKFSF